MAVMREELLLVDRFSQTANSYLSSAQKMSAATDEATGATGGFTTQSGKMGVEVDNNTKSVDTLAGSVRALAAAYGLAKAATWLVTTSDTLTSIDARLEMVTGSAEGAAQATEDIYAAAERARSSYTDMAAQVSKLGITAADSFSGMDEIVAFSEIVAKNFLLGGAAAQEQAAATYQLTQAMQSGRLQGDEYRSIIENAPLLAKSIEDYMQNVMGAQGALKDLAAEGLITADVIKAAVFASAEEVNAKVEELPYTWAQVANMAGNTFLQTMEPVLQAIGAAAQWASENIDTVNRVLQAFGIAVGIVAAAWVVYEVATIAAMIATQGLTAAMAANPIFAIISAIIFLTGIIYSAIVAMEEFSLSAVHTKLAWTLAWNGITLTLLDAYVFIKTFTADIELAFAHMALGIGSVMWDLGSDIVGIFSSSLGAAMDMINKVIGQINEKTGSSIQMFDADFNAGVIADMEADMAAREAALNRTVQLANREARTRENDVMIEYYVALNDLAAAQSAERAAEAGLGAGAYTFEGGDTSGLLEVIADGVGSIAQSVSMSDENLQVLRDLAERQYVNNINLTSSAPVITVNGSNTGNTAADRQAMADAIAELLTEQGAAGSYRTTARPI